LAETPLGPALLVVARGVRGLRRGTAWPMRHCDGPDVLLGVLLEVAGKVDVRAVVTPHPNDDGVGHGRGNHVLRVLSESDEVAAEEPPPVPVSDAFKHRVGGPGGRG
jgi:hypothetical protein